MYDPDSEAEQIRRLVDQAPPLTEQQRADLGAILRPAAAASCPAAPEEAGS